MESIQSSRLSRDGKTMRDCASLRMTSGKWQAGGDEGWLITALTQNPAHARQKQLAFHHRTAWDQTLRHMKTLPFHHSTVWASTHRSRCSDIPANGTLACAAKLPNKLELQREKLGALFYRFYVKDRRGEKKRKSRGAADQLWVGQQIASPW